MKFGGLWIGQPSLVEKIVWSSFVRNGHELTVFVYDDKISLPEGVIKGNANDIVDKGKLFYTLGPTKKKKSVSAFSDYFRYSMIKATGLAWTDSDALCLSENFTKNKYFFASDISKGVNWVANGTIVAPKTSKLISFLVESAEKTLMEQDLYSLKWGTLGPALLAEGVDKFNLRKYVVDSDYLHPLGIHEVLLPFNRSKAEEVKRRCKDSASLHLFNAILSEKSINKNNLPRGSFLHQKAQEYELIA